VYEVCGVTKQTFPPKNGKGPGVSSEYLIVRNPHNRQGTEPTVEELSKGQGATMTAEERSQNFLLRIDRIPHVFKTMIQPVMSGIWCTVQHTAHGTRRTAHSAQHTQHTAHTIHHILIALSLPYHLPSPFLLLLSSISPPPIPSPPPPLPLSSEQALKIEQRWTKMHNLFVVAPRLGSHWTTDKTKKAAAGLGGAMAAAAMHMKNKAVIEAVVKPGVAAKAKGKGKGKAAVKGKGKTAVKGKGKKKKEQEEEQEEEEEEEEAAKAEKVTKAQAAKAAKAEKAAKAKEEKEAKEAEEAEEDDEESEEEEGVTEDQDMEDDAASEDASEEEEEGSEEEEEDTGRGRKRKRGEVEAEAKEEAGWSCVVM
jgi:hypothetical protein